MQFSYYEWKKIFRTNFASNRFIPGVIEAFALSENFISDMKVHWNDATPKINVIFDGETPRARLDVCKIEIPVNTIFNITMESMRYDKIIIDSILKKFFEENKLSHIKIFSYNKIIRTILSIFIAHELGHIYLQHKANSKRKNEIEADIYSGLFLSRVYQSICADFKQSMSGVKDYAINAASFIMIGFSFLMYRAKFIYNTQNNNYKPFEDRLFIISVAFGIVFGSQNNDLESFKNNLLHIQNKFFKISEDEYNDRFTKITEEIEPILDDLFKGKSREQL